MVLSESWPWRSVKALTAKKLEARIVDGNVANQTRGSYFAFIIALTAICGGFFLIHEGRSIQGLAAMITSLGGLVGVFIYAKAEQRRERLEKIEALQQRMGNH